MMERFGLRLGDGWGGEARIQDKITREESSLSGGTSTESLEEPEIPNIYGPVR